MHGGEQKYETKENTLRSGVYQLDNRLTKLFSLIFIVMPTKTLQINSLMFPLLENYRFYYIETNLQ